MDLHLTYTNHKGESIGIGGDGIRHLMETDLFDHAWGWEVDGGTISTSVQPREIALPIGMFGGSLQARTRAFEILEADALEDALGSLSFNGYSLPCTPVAASLGNWWFADGIEERTVTLVSPRPLWSKAVAHSFPAPMPSADGWLDLPCDAPYDLKSDDRARMAEIRTVGTSEWRWIVYGPAANPYVIIDGNRHEVDVTVPEGSRLELDTRDRTVELVDQAGARTNVFPYRLRGNDGSGRYAFKPIPKGWLSVSADAALSFDIIVYDERMEPAWA